MNDFADRLESSKSQNPPLDDGWRARRRLANATRQLIEATLCREASAATYDALAENMEDAVTRLREAEERRGLLAHTAGGGIDRFVALSQETNAVAGLANALAPPLEFWKQGERAHGRVRCGWAYEGPPGCVHGGFVAALLDQFLGFAQTLSGVAGMTGKMEVRYSAPTPIDTELNLEAWVEERSGRAIYVRGVLRHGDKVTAKARCMFVEVPPGYLAGTAAQKDSG